MTKQVRYLCLALAILAVLGCMIIAISKLNEKKTGVAERSLTVLVDGKEYLHTALMPGKDITIQQENGCQNIIHMTENGFFMKEASCPNHECIDQGEVTIDNWKTRNLLEQIICLPNRVIVQLDIGQDERDMDVPDV